MTDIDWARVERGLERDKHKIVWRPYGLPDVTDPEHSAFFPTPVSVPWEIPEAIFVSVAVTGAFFTKRNNPAQPLALDDIIDQAKQCAAAGASTIHLHVRDDQGYNTLSYDRFERATSELRGQFPHLAIDGCLVAALDGEWDEMTRVLDGRLLDGVPINTTATYVGDALFAKPLPYILKKTELVLAAGAKPIIACYTDADVGNADRFLFKSGLLGHGQYWLILPALPGCSPMNNPRQMVEGLVRISSAIQDVDPEGVIAVCAAGRAAMYLVTVAAALGFHIRVGMEDTVWYWPHRQDRISSNMEMLQMALSLAEVLGRRVATHEEYRSIVGLSQPVIGRSGAVS
jgi:3-keto-5-aminohexanoate cleavage enzyme